jgi:uncharacterized RDD family membrane protein YckC
MTLSRLVAIWAFLNIFFIMLYGLVTALFFIYGTSLSHLNFPNGETLKYSNPPTLRIWDSLFQAGFLFLRIDA